MSGLGIAIAKRVFHGVGMHERGHIVVRQRLSRHDLRPFMDPRAHLRRNLRFRPPENSWRLYEPDFDFLDEFFGRFSTPNSLLSEPYNWLQV
jgi:hypothetical protein